jgi:hypothetical protein
MLLPSSELKNKTSKLLATSFTLKMLATYSSKHQSTSGKVAVIPVSLQ